MYIAQVACVFTKLGLAYCCTQQLAYGPQSSQSLVPAHSSASLGLLTAQMACSYIQLKKSIVRTQLKWRLVAYSSIVYGFTQIRQPIVAHSSFTLWWNTAQITFICTQIGQPLLAHSFESLQLQIVTRYTAQSVVADSSDRLQLQNTQIVDELPRAQIAYSSTRLR